MGTIRQLTIVNYFGAVHPSTQPMDIFYTLTTDFQIGNPGSDSGLPARWLLEQAAKRLCGAPFFAAKFAPTAGRSAGPNFRPARHSPPRRSTRSPGAGGGDGAKSVCGGRLPRLSASGASRAGAGHRRRRRRPQRRYPVNFGQHADSMLRRHRIWHSLQKGTLRVANNGNICSTMVYFASSFLN